MGAPYDHTMGFPAGRVFSPIDARFDSKVQKTEPCWLWTGFVDKAGYARLRAGGRDTPVLYAHRYSYERFVGPIPAGHTIDHVRARGCLHKHCVNPAHLEPVTNAENIRRSPASTIVNEGKCRRGHDIQEHGYRRKDGRFNCNECRRERRAAASG